MSYKNFDLSNDDVVDFMHYLKKYFDEGLLLSQNEIIDVMIDVVDKPHKYDDLYQKYRQMELINE